MLGHGLPLQGVPPDGKDRRPARRPRRPHRPADAGRPRRWSATPASALQALLPLLAPKPDRAHLDKARSSYDAWRERQQQLTDPGYDRKPKGLLRRKVDNPDARIRPELLAAAVDRHAAARRDLHHRHRHGDGLAVPLRPDDAARRRLLGSYNLGSMANAMPQALGAPALDRHRQVVAFCGDGGLSMLMGDLITAVSHDLPVKLVVFDNGRLGMVKLEMEQVGLPEFGTVLHNPDFAAVARAIGMRGVRVERPARRRRPRCARRSRTTARCWWTCSPTPTRSPYRPSRRSSRAGASRSPRRKEFVASAE